MPTGFDNPEFADLRVRGSDVIHLPSQTRTPDVTLLAMIRSHPRTVKAGLGDALRINHWLQRVDSEVRVHVSAVEGGPKAWLERGPDALLPVIEPRHT